MFTAPFHAASGNSLHAVKAAITGLTSGATALSGAGLAASTAAGVLTGALIDIPFTYVGNNQQQQSQPIKRSLSLIPMKTF